MYSKQNWVNGPDGGTPLSAERLTHIEDGVLSSHIYKRDRFDAAGRYYSPVTYWWADFYNGDESKWKKVLTESDVMGLVIINVSSGAGAKKDEDFAKQAAIARASGAFVIGYVLTHWGTRKHSEILTEIQHHIDWYGVAGVFLDEAVNGWGDQESKVAGYVELYGKIKKRFGPEFYVVANPGANTVEGMVHAADTLMVYEQAAERYLAGDDTYRVTPDYYRKYPSTKYWHVIHDVTTEEQARAVLAKAETSHVAHVYLTDGHFDPERPLETNPYAGPPSPWLQTLQAQWCRRMLPPAAAPAIPDGDDPTTNQILAVLRDRGIIKS
ncbi:spherulation-specific family 4 protein [Corynebacterium sp. TAE3-ERU16]|uniref:spherulation-specific family 4 protein n=1 Tax=Corynebacterium sp. TAE3-ERU16 TaxID=2849493 RepID=UPI001C485526|nr:spherulation-specific family 4 protein [Corynebacterium sp. TAE3-ERU16]MBV7292370.1 spherulation-specific family 4 protein [Corynebacterium sp. TAE3-ERU16]